jgi:hypothetical protein
MRVKVYRLTGGRMSTPRGVVEIPDGLLVCEGHPILSAAVPSARIPVGWADTALQVRIAELREGATYDRLRDELAPLDDGGPPEVPLADLPESTRAAFEKAHAEWLASDEYRDRQAREERERELVEEQRLTEELEREVERHEAINAEREERAALLARLEPPQDPAVADTPKRKRGRPKGTRIVPRDKLLEVFRALRVNYGRNPTQEELVANLEIETVRTLQSYLDAYELPWPIE